MGSIVSAVRDSLQAADKEVEEMAKESLSILEKDADYICDGFKADLEEKYKNPQEFDTWQVVGGHIDRESRFVGVQTARNGSKNFKAGLDHLVNGIFGDCSGEHKGTLHEACRLFVEGAFDAFFGSAAGGRSKAQDFLIIADGFQFYRMDVYLWKYRLRSKGFTDHFESQFVCLAARGILDYQHMNSSVIIAYAS